MYIANSLFGTLKIFGLSIFLFGGLAMIIGGILVISRLYGNRSYEADAECTIPNAFYPNPQRPIYRYTYNGKEYKSSPVTVSNRPRYRPVPGPCKIRINPHHPEIIYSAERKFSGTILIFLGILSSAGALAALLI